MEAFSSGHEFPVVDVQDVCSQALLKYRGRHSCRILHSPSTGNNSVTIQARSRQRERVWEYTELKAQTMGEDGDMSRRNHSTILLKGKEE